LFIKEQVQRRLAITNSFDGITFGFEVKAQTVCEVFLILNH
jgi:hypothetical protein